MREFSTPWEDAADPTSGNLTDAMVRRAEEHPGQVVVSRRRIAHHAGDRSGWQPVTAAELLADVRRTAKGFVAAGIQHGDRVVLMARTRYEWTVVDYALWFAGAVGVPAYETSSADQLGWVLADSGARAAVVETTAHAERVRKAAADTGAEDRLAGRLWTLDDGNGPALMPLARLGRDIDDEELERRRTAVGRDDVATLVYTSGTTGQSQGCVLSHGNFLVEVAAAAQALPELFEDPDAATLVVLPLAHVFARVVQVGAVQAGVRLGHCSDVRQLGEDLRSFRPTFLVGVPRLFERIFTLASQQAASNGRGRRFDRATDAAIAYSRALDSGRPSPLLRSRRVAFDRFVYRSLREALGGRCRYGISGGAPLGERLGHFYRGIGVPLLEGYGLAESTGAVTVSTPDAARVGSVGRPMPGTAVRIAEDGEILVRGGQVMGGYWNDRVASAAALTPDGWLRTGDLGEIDALGHLSVTGRAREMLVTTSGKNVSPALLEGWLASHPLVGACLVVGDGRPYVAALVTLDRDAVTSWAAERGLDGPRDTLVRHPDLRAEVQVAVDGTNAEVSQAEAIRRFEVLPDEWSEETGELTPSLKVRRNAMLRRYHEEIEALYADSD
ncbi:MAG: Long-chain-fatty-acid--CoA ligase @ Long-chain fatty-acid-CoA ligase, Mycobacterial subgroup FadD15 [uncultured Nocardioidaceae bacterium]|uniref:Long-chain-fatty-acid--CoA ligase @ Long-chain fatty-acid-CoA ligase, Mycobacterial subgroup FadD15 n=1 Tax=uncultured Nocardioidaceae bacterium TaxID=253824 RepID=A0A6J4MH80_9ACTN|nr:MAG: Long-chain-fatty-acid--CoA ligase @ Long-chain fatty-acid-CoA ligase, Mycobacterial subgroup FadD15 [uncultured Nocardioidaceae bacterium]